MKRRKQRRRKPSRRRERPTLRFTPYSWSKLLYLRDAGGTEVGGFGITSANDLLLVEDIRLMDQRCTAVTVEFADAAVADFFDEQVDCGRQPEQFARIWIHTHPGDCPVPSPTDEATFKRCFGTADWAVMFILAAGGATYARLQFNVGPGGAHRMRTEVDYQQEFSGTDIDAWDEEYDDHVLAVDPFQAFHTNRVAAHFGHDETAPAHVSEVLDEWFAQHEDIDLFPDNEEEDKWNRYLAAAD